MLAYLLASAGPLTSLLGELATSIGAGVVVGSFALGLGSFAASGSRRYSERWSLIGGYFGGAGGLGAMFIDIVKRHFV
jgi:hypothetical protein